MIYNITFRNNDISSWITLYIRHCFLLALSWREDCQFTHYSVRSSNVVSVCFAINNPGIHTFVRAFTTVNMCLSVTNHLRSSYAMTHQTPQLGKFPGWKGTVKCVHDKLERTNMLDTFVQTLAASTVICGVNLELLLLRDWFSSVTVCLSPVLFTLRYGKTLVLK
jgi:hypothetical protein